MRRQESTDLKAQWRVLFKQEPPARASRDFLQGHIRWAQQAKEQGGLKPKTDRQLKQLMHSLREGRELASDRSLSIKSGTKLIREYQGERHEVISTAEGFAYRGKTYRSLSSIAREITGTRWNGKLFFGVKKP